MAHQRNPFSLELFDRSFQVVYGESHGGAAGLGFEVRIEDGGIVDREGGIAGVELAHFTSSKYPYISKPSVSR